MRSARGSSMTRTFVEECHRIISRKTDVVMRLALLAALVAAAVWSANGVRGVAASAYAQAISSSLGHLNLTKRHPEASDGPTEFATLYTSTAALQRLDQMRGFLASFERLTDVARGRIGEASLRKIENTGGEIQSIGFHNIPLVVEGTLLKQEYEVKQLAYELARLKRLRGEIQDVDVERAAREYAEATRRFQTFWDTKRPTD